MLRERRSGSIDCSFSIALRLDDQQILLELQQRLGIGRVYSERVTNRRSKPQAAWRVHDKAGVRRLVEVFDRYPLRAKKARDFAIWRRAVGLWLSSRRDWVAMRRLLLELRATRRYGLTASP